MAEQKDSYINGDFTIYSSPKLNIKKDDVVLRSVVLENLPFYSNPTIKVEDDLNEKALISRKNIDIMNDEFVSPKYDIRIVPKLKPPKKQPTKIFQPFQSLIDIETTVNGLRDLFKNSSHSEE